jgi:hypothetical protein
VQRVPQIAGDLHIQPQIRTVAEHPSETHRQVGGNGTLSIQNLREPRSGNLDPPREFGPCLLIVKVADGDRDRLTFLNWYVRRMGPRSILKSAKKARSEGFVARTSASIARRAFG